jgi:hypothetical protein
MRILPNGNIGFETNQPQEKLHIHGGNIRLYKTKPIVTSNPEGTLIFEADPTTTYKTFWGIGILPNGGRGCGLNFWNSNNFNPGFNSVLFLQDLGNIGIGTEIPLATLDVNGSFRAKSANITETLSLTGNFGLGTSVPSQKLHVYNGNILITKPLTTSPLGIEKSSIIFDIDPPPYYSAPSLVKWGIEFVDAPAGFYGLNFWKCKYSLYREVDTTKGKDYLDNDDSKGKEYSSVLYFDYYNNVGIGTQSPQAALDVNGSLRSQSANITGVLNAETAIITNLSATTLDISSIAIDDMAVSTLNANKVNVNGKIKAKEIEVTLQGWGDHVFAEDYNLMPLNEVAQYIKENSHLPEIPSAKEVEENGIELGEMQRKLIMKIEELTLYILQQNEKMLELQKQIDELKKQ